MRSITETSHRWGKGTGKLLRAGKPGLSVAAPNSVRWEETENTAEVRDEAGEQSGALALGPDPKGYEELLSLGRPGGSVG